MLLQHSRLLLSLIALLTFLLTISSVRVLSGFIAAQHNAASTSQGSTPREWGRFIGQTEANIESHIPHLLHRDSKLGIKGEWNAEAWQITHYLPLRWPIFVMLQGSTRNVSIVGNITHLRQERMEIRWALRYINALNAL